ncbi:histone-lysine N-methyltransferase SETMAR-like [Stegodyphus dumicola]|uniref:histone-lysine N-methyltransferase SETMAR-like n=1 Tax=Stegodyphus dumicola TaxID=202533 RepID=UPI0015AB861A|nr:histone-lysine N-methyltransferase SETMAR-like [Stegodyphus dumicola]
MSLSDAPCSGRLDALVDEARTATIESDNKHAVSLLHTFRHLMKRRLYLHRIGKAYKLSKWVPHSLSDANSNSMLLPVCHCLLRTAVRTYLIEYSPAMKSGSSMTHPGVPDIGCHHRTLCLTLRNLLLHPRKIILCIWWTSRQVVHYELLPVGKTITAALCSQQLERVHQVLMHREPALVNRIDVLLLHDNARPHIAREAKDTIQRLFWVALPHLPYSPDLVPTDYHLFHSMDNYLHGKSFINRPDLEKALTDFFASKTPEFYCNGIAQLATHWQKALDADDDYFEDQR